ncbi:MAG: hypothetical protein H0U70_13395 [Tatlockia sp.]|nr:hypothetical protein [Tatlockia sp.]
MIKFCFLLSSILLMTACSQFDSNGDKFYLKSKNGSRVVVPPPLTNANISHFYDLPLQTKDPVVNIAPPRAAKTKAS